LILFGILYARTLLKEINLLVLHKLIAEAEFQVIKDSKRKAGRQALADFFLASIPSGATGMPSYHQAM
jgi:hypothetical protein